MRGCRLFDRFFRTRWPRAGLTAALPCAMLAAGCSAPEERPAWELDCSTPEGIRLEVIPAMQFETGDAGWFAYGDETYGAIPGADAPPAPEAEEIEDGGRCGSQRALVLRASGHDDWGAGFGSWSLATSPADGTGSAGLALWARSRGATDRAVLFHVNDRYSSEEGVAVDPETGETLLDEDGAPVPGCTVPDVEPGQQGACPGTDSQGNQIWVPCGQQTVAPTDCGNAFRRVLAVTEHWQLHLLPWDSFYQEALPNRRPEGIDPSAIHVLLVIVPRETRLELWLDDISFYYER
jgi:hypothetical protein